jgi:extracellular phospholipase A1
MHYIKLGENGLQSTIFQRTNAKTGKTEYAYVFAGTNSIEDGIEDISQVTLGAPQYNVAIDNARKLSNELKDSELTFVGHSLGGGLAAAASMATGKAAITFNRASVSDRTKSINNLGTLQNVADC